MRSITRSPTTSVMSPSGTAIIDIQLLTNKYLVCLSKDYTLNVLNWFNLSSEEDHIFEIKVNSLNFTKFSRFFGGRGGNNKVVLL